MRINYKTNPEWFGEEIARLSGMRLVFSFSKRFDRYRPCWSNLKDFLQKREQDGNNDALLTSIEMLCKNTFFNGSIVELWSFRWEETGEDVFVIFE